VNARKAVAHLFQTPTSNNLTTIPNTSTSNVLEDKISNRPNKLETSNNTGETLHTANITSNNTGTANTTLPYPLELDLSIPERNIHFEFQVLYITTSYRS
jgi:hypothetical protein